jgi:hypothetical protein
VRGEPRFHVARTLLNGDLDLRGAGCNDGEGKRSVAGALSRPVVAVIGSAVSMRCRGAGEGGSWWRP